MNASTRGVCRAWRAWPPGARTAAAIIATAAVALPAAACGETTPVTSNLPPASPQAKLLAFSRCMRSHGVPNFPDPQPGADNAKSPGAGQLRVSPSQLNAAERACQHLLPPGVDDHFPPAEVQLLLPGMRRFSRCVRSHGVPNWPDPSIDSEGRPVFVLSAHGFTLQQAHSPRITHTVDECQHLLPEALGGVPTG